VPQRQVQYHLKAMVPGQIMRRIIHSGAMHRLMLDALSLHMVRVMFIMSEPVFVLVL
jgi:hypothetical protein